MKLSDFKYNENLAKDGIWVTIDEGARIKVSKLNHPKYRELVNQLRKPYRSYEVAKRDLPDEVVRNITIEACSREILRDWEGITDDEGKSIPFNLDNAKEALRIDAFLSMVLGFAADDSLFRDSSLEEDAKNSQKSLPSAASSKDPEA